MKVTAGFGSVEDYKTLVEAGADEVYCGFVPEEWTTELSGGMPLNRREVLFYHVQIGSMEDMVILSHMQKKYGVPVTITFNSLYYLPWHFPVIADYIRQLWQLGFEDYTVADVNLIRYLAANRIPCKLHISGEVGEENELSMQFFCRQFDGEACQIKRFIFPRQSTLQGIGACIRAMEKNYGRKLEYEAFILNEKCNFNGGYCNIIHCDDREHLCMMDYRVEKASLQKWVGHEDGFGGSGCGVCDMQALEQAGVTHLKIVGRGASAEQISEDVKAVKEILRGQGLPKPCSKNCYYDHEFGP